MKRDFITNLPSEITTNILSRLPLRNVAISKCVCKPWLHLLESDDFVKSHLSKTKTPPALAVLMPAMGSSRCTVFELEDEVEVEVDLSSHDCHYNPRTKFYFPHKASIEGTANGLLLLYSEKPQTLYICNPLTRDYVELCLPEQSISAYGFGVSKISGQHKVVCINLDSHYVYAYTLGTGSWRRVKPSPFRFHHSNSGALVNGNLHWIVSSDSDSTEWICCFDVETECFSTFPAPPLQKKNFDWHLFALRGCLCFCEILSVNEIAIWLVKDYNEVEKSWTKEFVIPQCPRYSVNGFVNVQPIKVFKNGDILMLCDGVMFFYYSNKTKTTQKVGLFGAPAFVFYMTPMLLTPSFLSLKSFGVENVISLAKVELELEQEREREWVSQYEDLRSFFIDDDAEMQYDEEAGYWYT